MVRWGYGDHHIPHASKKLDETTVAESRRNDNVWLGDAACADVDEREDKGGEGESAETERSWVGKLATCGWLVETGLELSSEGWEPGRLPGVHMGQWVSSVVKGHTLMSGAGGGAIVVGVIMDGGSIVSGIILLVECGVGGSGGGHCVSNYVGGRGMCICIVVDIETRLVEQIQNCKLWGEALLCCVVVVFNETWEGA
jgi:hypothetical protein